MWEKLKKQWGIQKKYTQEEVDDLLKSAVSATIEGALQFLESDNVKAVFIKSGKDVPGCEIVNVGVHPVHYIKAELLKRDIELEYNFGESEES